MNKVYYKGFNNDFTCRCFQFEIGKTYKHEGNVKACESGFHSCENPWDVLSYYYVTNRFAMVEIGGETSTHSDDSKIASSEITIKAELKLSEFISSCIQWLQDYCSRNASSGNNARNASSGNNACNASSGAYARNASSGAYARNASSGNNACNASSGAYTRNASSGNNTQNASSGAYACNASSGAYARNASSGAYTRNASSGNNTRNYISGDNSISVDAGLNGEVKVGKNGTAVLTYWVDSEKRYRVSVGYEGENINAGVWYKLDDKGNFVECEN